MRRRWDDNIKMRLVKTGCKDEVEGIDSESCPVADFGISVVETWGSSTKRIRYPFPPREFQ